MIPGEVVYQAGRVCNVMLRVIDKKHQSLAVLVGTVSGNVIIELRTQFPLTHPLARHRRARSDSPSHLP